MTTQVCTFQQCFKQHAAQATAPFIVVASDKVKADPAGGDHAIWTVEHLPKDQVALKAHNGHYLSVNKQGQIHMTKARDNDCHFVFVKEELDHAGCVAIKDLHHGHFLEFDEHGHLHLAKKGDEKEDPFHLPFFKMDEHTTAHKGDHHKHLSHSG